MNPTINHDEDCYVQQLEGSNCFVCVAEEHVSDICPHATYYGFLYNFCTHPYRAEFSRKRLPEFHPSLPAKDDLPRKIIILDNQDHVL
jgi:hypothetical protein